MQVVGKLSVATAKTDPSKAKKLGEGQRYPLMRIMGTATGLKAAVDASGEPIFGLTGQFLGINVASKEEFTSGVCYLPGGLQEFIQGPLEAQMNSEDKVTANSASVQFIMDVYSIPATNKSGYSFSAELLGEPAKADPFEAMRKQVAKVELPALPAPVAA